MYGKLIGGGITISYETFHSLMILNCLVQLNANTLLDDEEEKLKQLQMIKRLKWFNGMALLVIWMGLVMFGGSFLLSFALRRQIQGYAMLIMALHTILSILFNSSLRYIQFPSHDPPNTLPSRAQSLAKTVQLDRLNS